MVREVVRPVEGHVLDIDALELPPNVLSRAHNVHTRKIFPSRIGGRRVAYPVSAGGLPNDPLHLLNLSLNTFNWWMSFGASTIYGVEGPNNYNISMPGQLSVASIAEWSSCLLNGIPVFTNGKNPLSFWAGSGGAPAATVPAWPAATVCKAVVAFKFHLFALNIDQPAGTFENKIMWSAATDPGALPASWTPSAANEAGSAILAETSGRCMNGRPLGERLFIYKPTSIYSVEYFGQQPARIFDVKCALRTMGLLSPHCLSEYGRRGSKHFVVGNDDVVLFDGNDAVSIASDYVRRTLASSIDETNAQNCFVIRDPSNTDEMHVCIPEAGNQFATLDHKWDGRRWTTRDLNLVRYGTTGYVTDTTPNNIWNAQAQLWDSDIRVWNQGSVGSIVRVVLGEASKLYVEDTSDLVSVTATLARYDMIFGDELQRKTTTLLRVLGTGLGFADVQARLGSRNAVDDANPITWGTLQSVSADGIPFEVNGRFISFELQITSTELWTVDRIIVEAEYDGAF